MATARKRKTNTALVVNPRRGLSLGSRRSVAAKATAKRNPTRPAVTAKSAADNPRRRRRRRNPASTFGLRIGNPSSITGLVVAATMTAASLTVFDLVASRLFPQNSLMARVGVKLGAAALFQSGIGSKIPFAGKYKNEIALVLAVLGMGDLIKAYVVPPVNQIIGNVTGGALNLLPAPAAAPASTELGTVYGWRQPVYV